MESRRLTFTLKPKGSDKIHDVAFDLLKNLPKGYRADLVAQAVYEYIMSRDGIHMVKEQNGVKILNIGKSASIYRQEEHPPEIPVFKEPDPLFEPKPIYELPHDATKEDNSGQGSELDKDIAAWFSEN